MPKIQWTNLPEAIRKHPLPVRQESLDSIRKYARLPQGRPPDVDPASLGLLC